MKECVLPDANTTTICNAFIRIIILRYYIWITAKYYIIVSNEIEMPCCPINKCLPATVGRGHTYVCSTDIQTSRLETELSRTTHFNKTEVFRFSQMHYILTKYNTIPMDKLSSIQFMDVFLGVRNVDVPWIKYICFVPKRTRTTWLGPSSSEHCRRCWKGPWPTWLTFASRSTRRWSSRRDTSKKRTCYWWPAGTAWKCVN